MLTLSAALSVFKRPRIPLPDLLGLDTPDRQGLDTFFFASPLIAQRLMVLRNMISRPGQVIVVLGERGSGKTTLLRQLAAALGPACRPARLRLKAAGGQSPPGTFPALSAFRIDSDAHPPAVVIDDAHRLGRMELKVLLAEAFDRPKRSKISSLIFFAEPEMRMNFDAMALWMPSGTVIDKIYMSPLTEKQTDEYLRFRFKIAGFMPEHPFSPAQIRAIFQVSGGLPGGINGEACMLLKRLYSGKRPFRKPFFAWRPL